MKQKRIATLTMRERKLIAGIVAGLTVSAAARRAGYSTNTIDDRIHEIVGRSRVRLAIDQILEGQGISDERLAKALSAGLEATKLIPGGHSGGPDGQSYMQVPDYNMRQKYLEILLKLKGYLVNKGQDSRAIR